MESETKAENSTPTSLNGHRLFAEATKLAVLAGFGLYSIGFLTWQSYLSKYGASAVGFLRVEYVSAAFCYLFVLLTIAGPPAVLFDHWQQRRAGKPGSDASVDIVLLVWFLLVLRFLGVFFPGGAYSFDWLTITVASFAAAYLVLYVICVAWYDWKIPWRWLNPHIFGVVYSPLIVLLFLFSSGINKGFLVWTILLYWFVVYLMMPTVRVRDAWTESNLLVRVLIVSLLGLVIVSHVQSFGSSVFGAIPRRAGGGKPETAFIRFAPQHSALAPALNLPATNTVGISNGFVGPISILLKSEKEILFVDHAELYSSTRSTNVVTNIVFHPTTNRTGNVVTVITNTTVAYTTNITEKPYKGAAKQIRADVLDAVIFYR